MNFVADKYYCMSSFLMLRTIYDDSKCFSLGCLPKKFEQTYERTPVNNSYELEYILKERIDTVCKNNKVALALSGGIDSAILARLMPKGSTAYTFKCVVPGIKVTDESDIARKYARECGLKHKVIEIYWEDFQEYTSLLMKQKGLPIHSIEVQIYKASLQAKKDGFDILVFGESADVNYGGQDGLLSKDWTVPEFIDRYSYILPYKVLKKPIIITDAFQKYQNSGIMDVHEFNRHVYYTESMGSYQNATTAAGIKLEAPYSHTYMGIPLDYNRVRNGESKYFVREIFNRLYPGFPLPKKIPMPRPMNEWLKNWKGPVRSEFWENCIGNMTGDQKWMIWSLEAFLNLCSINDL